MFGFDMARESKQPIAEPSAAGDSQASEKPLPEPRPGTSGTEMLLTTNRRTASQKYQQAQRAERTYKAKKRSALARANMGEAKMHFRESARHLRQGLGLTFGVFASLPWIVTEKSEARRAKAEVSKRKKALEKKKRLEDALAKEHAAAAGESDAGTENGEASGSSA